MSQFPYFLFPFHQNLEGPYNIFHDNNCSEYFYRNVLNDI